MEETVAARRSKRSTAGNRMEAALAEFKAEDIGVDMDEDADFALDKGMDEFEADFESTDEEGEQEEVDATAESIIRQEETRARKTARTHLERITALAHARQADTFNPQLSAPPEKEKGEKRPRRRVSLGVAVDAETGEVTSLDTGAVEEAESASAALGRRHSMRAHTVANTSATVNRVKDEERKQFSAPKRTKSKTKMLTQEELIARALAMEEGNIEEHKNYLTVEEEKRRKARLVRTSVQGPLLRWISKPEEITVVVEPAPPPPPPAPPTNPWAQSSIGYPAPSSSAPPPTGAPGYSYTPTTSTYIPPPQSPPYTQTSPFQQWPPPLPPPAVYHAPSPQPPPPPPPREPIIRTEKVAKQYVVHELEQSDKAPRPSWNSTMTAMFGDHADWEHMRVYTTKGRPLSGGPMLIICRNVY
ncbi:hypothetical protein BN946_scf184920.g18, partial [Trametes cinnabarina]